VTEILVKVRGGLRVELAGREALVWIADGCVEPGREGEYFFGGYIGIAVVGVRVSNGLSTIKVFRSRSSAVHELRIGPLKHARNIF
jgi:hypothetical protein